MESGNIDKKSMRKLYEYVRIKVIDHHFCMKGSFSQEYIYMRIPQSIPCAVVLLTSPKQGAKLLLWFLCHSRNDEIHHPNSATKRQITLFELHGKPAKKWFPDQNLMLPDASPFSQRCKTKAGILPAPPPFRRIGIMLKEIKRDETEKRTKHPNNAGPR